MFPWFWLLEETGLFCVWIWVNHSVQGTAGSDDHAWIMGALARCHFAEFLSPEIFHQICPMDYIMPMPMYYPMYCTHICTHVYTYTCIHIRMGQPHSIHSPTLPFLSHKQFTNTPILSWVWSKAEVLQLVEILLHIR
jgi:hypothetical protein